MSGIAEAAVVWKLKSANTNAGTRAFPRIAPEGSNKTPYLIVDRPPGQQNPQISTGPSFLKITPMTVYCVCDEKSGGYIASRALGRQVEAALNPSNVTGSVQWNGTWIDHCVVTQTYEASAPPQLADEVGWPIEAIDIVLYHLNCDSSG